MFGIMSAEQCKLDFVADRYGLDEIETRYESLDDRLLSRWTGESGSGPDGYRTLTEWFNKRLLKVVYDEHGRKTTGNRVESDYEALTGSDDLLREELEDNLRADGIDVERYRNDTISWSTMREHLTACLDGRKETGNPGSDWERESVAIATDVTASKVEAALSSLATSETLPDGDRAGVTIQVLLDCPDCQTRIPFEDAERGFVCDQHFPTAASTRGET
jgi:hypothetical protein